MYFAFIFLFFFPLYLYIILAPDSGRTEIYLIFYVTICLVTVTDALLSSFFCFIFTR